MTVAPQTPGTCNQCLFWQPLEVFGYCHFSAPGPGGDIGIEGRVVWPRTLPTDWCGQWQQAALQREVQEVP